jgi:LysR family glycine cleavage system transcriptional activator
MTLHLPPLATFRAFAAVARAGSFAGAAAQLNVSTSAVSHQIRALEEALGAELLVRARNGAGATVPTAAGQTLLAAVEDALGRLTDACQAVHDRAHQSRPSLVVSANTSVASLWLAPRLAAFAGEHPSVAWQMRDIDEAVPDLLREGIDLAVIRIDPAQLAPGDRLLFADTIFPVASPSLAWDGGPEGLLRHNLLEEEHRQTPALGWRHWLARFGLPAGRARIVRFSSFNQTIGAAIAGAGIALGRSPLVDDDLATGRLVRLLAPHEAPGSSVFALRTRPGQARDPHVAHLREHLLGFAGAR